MRENNDQLFSRGLVGHLSHMGSLHKFTQIYSVVEQEVSEVGPMQDRPSLAKSDLEEKEVK